MPNDLTAQIVRDALLSVNEIDNAKVLRAVAKEVVRQIGKEKVKEMGRRTLAAYIEKISALPFDGAIARRLALPALDAMLDDVLAELEK